MRSMHYVQNQQNQPKKKIVVVKINGEEFKYNQILNNNCSNGYILDWHLIQNENIERDFIN